ncbi:MAG TPA: DUF4019 domain-containing protein [Rhodanobacteraceae bacterium]|nr:DUF4019 domain-containing protein [Rhodanobacteraceae bacterium]
MLKRFILPAALALAAGGAWAQQPAAQPSQPANSAQPQQLTKEQQEFRARMAKNAQGITESVDQGNVAALWDQSSDVMKQAVTRDAFVSGVQGERAKLGKMVSRQLVRMYRITSKGENKLPAGNYLNVLFATRFANDQQPMAELVSYHFDKDNVVRLSGYTVQKPTPAKQASNGH